MLEWNELMKGHLFVSDLGESFEVEIEGETTRLGRYAVWAPVTNSEGHKIIEVGDGLDQLCKKYEISEDRICILNKG